MCGFPFGCLECKNTSTYSPSNCARACGRAARRRTSVAFCRCAAARAVPHCRTAVCWLDPSSTTAWSTDDGGARPAPAGAPARQLSLQMVVPRLLSFGVRKATVAGRGARSSSSASRRRAVPSSPLPLLAGPPSRGQASFSAQPLECFAVDSVALRHRVRTRDARHGTARRETQRRAIREFLSRGAWGRLRSRRERILVCPTRAALLSLDAVRWLQLL